MRSGTSGPIRKYKMSTKFLQPSFFFYLYAQGLGHWALSIAMGHNWIQLVHSLTDVHPVDEEHAHDVRELDGAADALLARRRRALPA
jgi:hypothetical protein